MTKIDSKRAVDYGKREQAEKRPRARVSLFPLPIVPSALSFSFLPIDIPASHNTQRRQRKRHF